MPTRDELKLLQALPLELKVRRTKQRIKEWVEAFGEDGVYVSFSGGKDSTVLLHIVRELYPSIEGVYVDTGLEFPEIREFVKKVDNIVWLKPKLNFKKVIEQEGYPFFSKEISSNIQGAKRYIEEKKRGDVRLHYAYNYRRIQGIGEYAKQGLGQGKRVTRTSSDNNGNVEFEPERESDDP